MLKVILSSLCVLVAASPLSAAITAANIAGRWQGDSWAQDRNAKLTLDIVACGSGWCGIRVSADNACGATALKLAGGAVDEDTARYEGTLELAPGTEPYTVQAAIFPPEDGKPLQMQLTGDTGGQFRAYRRSFPFEAALVRIQDPVCQAPQTVSSLR